MTKDEMLQRLNYRLGELEEIISKTNRFKAMRVDGVIRFSHRKNSDQVQYYQHKADGSRKYLGKKDDDTIRNLVWKRYITSIQKAAKAEAGDMQRAISVLSRDHDSLDYSRLYRRLPDELKKYVNQNLFVSVCAREFSEQAISEMKRYKNDNFITINKERVRSKSELFIANMLQYHKIRYKYEMNLALDPDEEAFVCPDFTIMHPQTGKIIVWEHFGRIGDPEYDADMVKKLSMYSQYGYVIGDRLIATFESRECPLATKQVVSLIEAHLLN